MSSLRHGLGLLVLAGVMFFCASSAEAGPTRYPEGRIHSPMSAAVVARLKRVFAFSGGAMNAFVKIGDSNTANPGFSSCLAGKDIKLGAYASLETTRRFFGAHKVDSLHTSFDRVSLAAGVGWLTGKVLSGAPSLLEREISAVRPAFAIIMLGTNDNRVGGFDAFARNMAQVIDKTLALGVVPIVSTIPPRSDSPTASARVLDYNRTIRALAEDRQVPLVDLYSALLPLPRRGLVDDGIHLATLFTRGSPRGCWFGSEALKKGMNMRNLVMLTALDRSRRFLVENEAPEAEPEAGA